MKLDSSENEILLNPRWPVSDLEFLQNGAKQILRNRFLHSHVVLSSSGTTAESWRAVKLIFLSKDALKAAAQTVVNEFGLNEKDVFAQSLPEFHVGGVGVQIRAALCGASVVMVSQPGTWSAGKFAEQIEQSKITVASLVPTQLHDLVAANLKSPTSLRLVFMGGGVLSAELETQARALGWPLVVTYGMTETSAMIAARKSTVPGDGLTPFQGVEGRLTQERNLQIRAPGLATGVARLKETAQGPSTEWQNLLDKENWFTSEDFAAIEGGQWKILGRGHDFIKIGGESVNLSALREIFENLCHQQRAPTDAMYLTSLPSKRTGFKIVLAYKGDRSEVEKISQAFDSKVLPFEKIREIIPVDEWPRTELGKIREEELKKTLSQKRKF